MSFYTFFKRRGNKIQLRFVDDEGKRRFKNVPYSPHLRISSNEGDGSKDIFGNSLKRIDFDSMTDAKSFIDEYSNVSGFEIFGNSAFEYQYVEENFDGEITFDFSKIRTFFIDIETEVNNEFPKPFFAKERINLITVLCDDVATVFSLQNDYVPTMEHDCKSVEIKEFNNDEELLLKAFLDWWSSDFPDIVTGWNSNDFDIPYIVNRISNVLGENESKRLSPYNTVSKKPSTDAHELKFVIDGISCLDYLELFKKYTPNARASYALGEIAYEELKETKLDHDEYPTFKEFYTENWNKFVDYNIRDAILVRKLEQKLELLRLHTGVAYLTKTNYSDVFSPVKIWDIFIQNTLSKDGVFVKSSVRPKDEKSIMGGFVMDPLKGRHFWTVGFDATSLYPTIMMTWNISPETKIRSVEEIPEELRQYYDRNNIDFLLVEENLQALHKLLTKHNLCMTPNGMFFRRDVIGIIPRLCEDVFTRRAKAKKEMILLEKEYEVSKEDSLSPKISALNNLQLALKIFLNSLFGAQANKFFRFADADAAEGITSAGQLFIRYVGRHTEKYVNALTGTKHNLVYSDTDSIYIKFDSLVEKLGKIPDSDVVEILDKYCKNKVEKENNIACKELERQFNTVQSKLSVKREKICSSALWTAKKRYALLVWDNEGVRHSEPELSVTGIEVRRSSTPKVVRDSLTESIILILTKSEETFQQYVADEKARFKTFSVEEISFPRGVSDIEKFQIDESYGKGTPIGVKAAILYNSLVKGLHLESKYVLVSSGNKIKFVSLRLPNPIREPVIGYVSKLPAEFGLHDYVDYDTQFEKAFISPLTKITDAIGWTVEPVVNLQEWGF